MCGAGWPAWSGVIDITLPYRYSVTIDSNVIYGVLGDIFFIPVKGFLRRSFK
jgi:hypothetical protein